MISIAERIRRWRESREDLTQAEVARAVGISRQGYRLWESGDAEPTHANVEKFATAIGVSLPVFWGEPPPAKRKTKAS
jgi:transcriptional regulator with XRE-family HTH domain